MELLSQDKGNPKLPRHFKPSLQDDEFETPDDLYYFLSNTYKVYPLIDAAATRDNTKCSKFFTKEDNALEQEWLREGWPLEHPADIWLNDPHTLHAEFTEKAYQQWQKYNMNIMMIIPANCGRTSYWHKFIEGIAEYHMIKGSIRFLKNGKPTKDTSRNAYVVVIWRRRS